MTDYADSVHGRAKPRRRKISVLDVILGWDALMADIAAIEPEEHAYFREQSYMARWAFVWICLKCNKNSRGRITRTN